MNSIPVKIIIIAVLLFFSISYSKTSDAAEDFNSFIIQFSMSEGFQLSRVSFPLPYRDTAGPATIYYTLDKWHHLNLIVEGKQTNRTVKKKSTGIIIHYKGKDNDQDSYYYFRLKNNRWYLWKIVNEGL